MKYFLGIDIGSTSIKIALLNEQNELSASSTSPTGSRFHKNAAIRNILILPDDKFLIVI